MLTSAREVEARIRAGVPGRWAVGDGAYLQIAKTKGPPKGSWVFRYWRDGKSVWMGLGPTSLVSLAKAKKKARAGRELRLDDIDPRQHRRDTREAKRAKERAELSLRDAVRDFLAVHEATWRSAKHAAQWRSTMATILPQLGSRPVAAIDAALINDVTAPLVLRTPVTGARVRQRITKVLDWVKAGKPLPQALVAKPVKHLAAAPWQTLPALMAELRAVDTIPARALELTVLTASRTSTVTGAVWSEFDLAHRVWRIPAARMKAERDHNVPLSDRVMAILVALPREGDDRLFGGRAKGGALGDKAMARTLARIVPPETATVHGFRSAFSDWAHETSGAANHVIELALAHAIGNKVEAAYRRGDLFAKRTKLMRDWDRYCASTPDGAVVLPLARKA